MKKFALYKYACAGSVAFLTSLAYMPALENEFVNWDDGIYVFDNENIRAFSAALFMWAFFKFHHAFWGPITWISHALDYAVWELNPMGHHLTNVILHAMNAFIVVLLVRKLLDAWRARSGSDASPRSDLIAAGVTGLLFGLHPVHVESVAWVTERKDLLSSLFYLLTIIAYISYGGVGGPAFSGKNILFRFVTRFYLAALGLFVLALMSKPMAVSLPAVLLVLDWYPLERIRSAKDLRAVLVEKIPFFALSLSLSIITILAQTSGGALHLMGSTTFFSRVLVAVKSLVAYMGNMILPIDLVPFYPFPREISLLSWAYLLPLVLVTGITAAAVVLVKKQKIWLAVWCYYLITLLPVLGIVQVGEHAMADRFLYLPSLGPFLLIGLACSRVFGMFAGYNTAVKLLSVAVALTALAVFFSLTLKQIAVWKNSITLWNYVIEKRPWMSRLPYINRGLAFISAGRLSAAIEDFTTAIDLDPSFCLSYNNRGLAFLQSGRWDNAIKDLNKAIDLEPSFCEAYINRGQAFLNTGRFGRAIEDFTIASRMDPSAESQNRLAVAYGKAGLFREAFEHFDRAISLDRNYAKPYFNSGLLNLKIGNIKGAAYYFEKACGLGNPEACAAFRQLEQASPVR